MEQTIPNEGDCFHSNGTAFLDLYNDPSCFLVHGVVLNSKGNFPMLHCWIEKELQFQQHTQTLCIDLSNGHAVEIPADWYYQLGRIKKTTRYTLEMARKHILESGHWGAWDQALLNFPDLVTN